MKIVEVKDRTSFLINQLLDVWEDSVEATHLFLTNQEIKKIKEYVPQALKEVAHLLVIENDDNSIIAFMEIKDRKLEMLFIKNDERRKGLGKRLVNYGIENYSVNELAVNEQNFNAKEFYESMGFRTYKRTELDEQGNPYPILYMRLNN